MTKLDGKIYGLFPSVLMRVRVAERESDFNAKLRLALEDIRKTTPNGLPRHSAGAAYITRESDNRLHLRAELADIVELAIAEAKAYADKTMLDLSVGNLQINDCWLTVLEKGEAVEMHTNPSSIFTATYFINTSRDGAKFRFFSSVGTNWPFTPATKSNPLNKRIEVIRVFPGEFVVFPSNLINDVHGHDDDTGHVSLTFTFGIAPYDRV